MRDISGEVFAYTSNRFAGTTLATALYYELPGMRRVRWLPVEEATTGQGLLAIVLAHQESPESVPRLIQQAIGKAQRVVVVYDQGVEATQILDAARSLGAWSMLDAREGADALLDMVEAAIAGRRGRIDTSAAGWKHAIEGEATELTRREFEVIEVMFAEEGTNLIQVAEVLGLSVNTVRVHVANVRRKLAGRYTGNRDALRSALIDQGWLD